ncbi:hypothetical protein H4219_003008 [Mycoemilia scoparia]|uniref:Uncharacterized protein n=1 Tax=Mycoemilia scoparia TaxID=417184 RepID=A0A9W8A400_9FUNG|nr:hypothetical protein H4219_003008 [Mycoemilia scoparia]
MHSINTVAVLAALAALANAQGGLEQYFSANYDQIRPRINTAIGQFSAALPELYNQFTSALGGSTELPAQFNPQQYSQIIGAFGGEEAAVSALQLIGITVDAGQAQPTGSPTGATESASGSSASGSSASGSESSASGSASGSESGSSASGSSASGSSSGSSSARPSSSASRGSSASQSGASSSQSEGAASQLTLGLAAAAVVAGAALF